MPCSVARRRAVVVVAFLAASVAGAPRLARAQRPAWHGAAAGGVDAWLHPDAGAQGFALFELRGERAVGRGDLRALFNTDTLQLAVEGVPLGAGGVAEFGAYLRGEGLIAGVLINYFANGVRRPERGFFASYVAGAASLKLHVAERHTIELLAGARQWIFGRIAGTTDPQFVLPPNTGVLEPRLRYIFWAVTSDPGEWGAQVLFPRVTGVAVMVELGLDARANARAWGAPGDARNRPGAPIWMAREWLRAGAPLGAALRVQIDQVASWGVGEDDLTRMRAGGMNPWSVTLPGLGWPALLSERLVAAQVGLYLRPWLRHRHEIGVLAAGGVFNDVNRAGALDTFGGAAGFALHGDLRFGAWQFYLRAGYAVPVTWLRDPPQFGAFAGVGVALF